MTDAFDADVLIYAADTRHALGAHIRRLFEAPTEPTSNPQAGVGSVLLIPEVFIKPTREGRADEVDALLTFVARLDLFPVDPATAELATALGAKYRLRPMDAVHLGTAVRVGAERFITNNRRDFDPATIEEIEIVHPDDLA